MQLWHEKLEKKMQINFAIYSIKHYSIKTAINQYSSFFEIFFFISLLNIKNYKFINKKKHHVHFEVLENVQCTVQWNILSNH